MNEDEPGDNQEDADFVAPNTGTPASEPPDYSPRTVEERDVALRNADYYLLKMEEGRDKKEQPLKETSGQRALRWVGRHTENLRSLGGSLKVKSAEEFDDNPLIKAYKAGQDEKGWESLLEQELKKGEGKQDLNLLKQASLFRAASEMKVRAVALLDERRTAPYDRQDEIDQELNLAYYTLMTIAHTKSVELVPVYEEKTVRSKINRQQEGRRDGESAQEWRDRVSPKKDVRTLKSVRPEIGVTRPFGDSPDASIFRKDVTEKHNAWLEDRAKGEKKGEYATGFEKTKTTTGEFNKVNAEALRPITQQLSGLIDHVIDTVAPDELKSRYGLEMTKQKPEDVKKYSYIRKENNKSVSVGVVASPDRYITMQLGNGQFAVFSLTTQGFIREVGEDYELKRGPINDQSQEFVSLRQTVISYKDADGMPRPTVTMENPDREMIRNSREFGLLMGLLERIRQDYP